MFDCTHGREESNLLTSELETGPPPAARPLRYEVVRTRSGMPESRLAALVGAAGGSWVGLQ